MGLHAQSIISSMKMTVPNPISNPIFNTGKFVREYLSHMRIFSFKLPQSVEKINFPNYRIGAKLTGFLFFN